MFLLYSKLFRKNIDSQPLSTENGIALPCSNDGFFQGSNPSIIHNGPPCSRADRFNEVKEPLLAQLQNFSAGDLKVEESEILLKKVKEIDEKFSQGWFFAYELWLSFVIVAAVSKGVFLVASVQDWWYGREYDLVKIIAVPLGLALHCSLWSVKQAWLQREAMKKKDHRKAAEAYRSAVRLAIYYFIVCVMFLLVVIYWQYFDSRRRRDWITIVCYLAVEFLLHFVIPVGISVYGSYKVKVLLQEKMDLVESARNGDDGQSSAQIISQ